jgi:hypothetical protein
MHLYIYIYIYIYICIYIECNKSRLIGPINIVSNDTLLLLLMHSSTSTRVARRVCDILSQIYTPVATFNNENMIMCVNIIKTNINAALLFFQHIDIARTHDILLLICHKLYAALLYSINMNAAKRIQQQLLKHQQNINQQKNNKRSKKNKKKQVRNLHTCIRRTYTHTCIHTYIHTYIQIYRYMATFMQPTHQRTCIDLHIYIGFVYVGNR